MNRNRQQGYVMFTVVVMLFVIAITTYLVGFDTSFKAGQPASELESARADYLVEAAMQHALWKNRNIACVAEFTLPVTTLGGDSYTAAATGGGGTRTESISVDQDGWIRSDDVTRNHATDKKGHVQFEAGKMERAVYRYDLASLAAGSRINSAIGWFYLNAGQERPTGPVTVHRITVDWTDLGATWATLADHFDPAPVAVIPAQDQRGAWVQVNLTAQVQAWVNGQPNYGLMLQTETEGFHETFANIEDGGNPPRLDVTVGTSPVAPVVINAKGTLANGVTRSAGRANVTTYQPVSAFAAETGAAVDDTWVSESGAGINYGNGMTLHVGDDGTVRHALLRFDLLPVPVGAHIVSAELSLNLESVTAAPEGAAISAHRVLEPWTENGATFNTADGATAWDWPQNHDASGAVVSVPFESPSPGWIDLDIQPIVTEWIANGRPQFGLVLTSENGVSDAAFTSSDGLDPALHPRLSVAYACGCGSVCLAPRKSSGGIVLVVDNDNSLSPYERSMQAMFESFGYTVTPLTSNASQGAYDTAAADNDLFFVLETAADNKVKDKLDDVSLGVVSIQGTLNDELGFATGSGSAVDSSIDIVDNGHYITQPFPPGELEIYPGGMQGLTVSGAPAPELTTLGNFGGAGGLVILERGAALQGSGLAAGRRVMLPVGRNDSSGFSWDNMNNNGRFLMYRSIEWALRGDGTGGVPLLFVTPDSDNITDQDLLKQNAFESWGYDVRFLTASEPQAVYDAALANVAVAFVSEEIASVDIQSKLTGATVGVVSEEGGLVDELGFADDFEVTTTDGLTIDNSFFVTSPLASGQVTVMSTPVDIGYLTGALAPDLEVLATNAGGASIVQMEAGVRTIDGIAAGRRILLPWTATDMDFNDINDDGLLLLERALEWAADPGGAKTSAILLSTDHDATLGGLNFKDEDIVLYRPWNDTATLFLDGSSVSLNEEIDALHLLANGNLLLSTKGTASLGGLTIDDDDLAEYDPATDTAELLFDGGALFDDPNEKIISVGVLKNGHLLISTDSDATLGGLSFSDKDLVEYDLHADSASLYLDGGALGLDKEITASQVLKNGHFVLAPKGDTSLGGTEFGAGDLVVFDPTLGVAELLFQGAALFGPGGGKINSVHLGRGSGSIACDGTFRDEFNAETWSGSDGTREWSGNWLEIGENDGADKGDIRVEKDGAEFMLRTKDDGEGVQREVDLSGAGSATLRYDFRREKLDNGNDYTVVEISANGAAGPWTELVRHQGDADDGAYQPANHDITAWASGNTRIRFVTSNDMGDKDIVWFDNVEISCSP